MVSEVGLGLEVSFTGNTIVVLVFVMLLQFIFIVKELIALLAVIVAGTSSPVLFQPIVGREILVTVVADVVSRVVINMLLISVP